MDDDVRFLELLDLEAEAGEEEPVAWRQSGREAFFDRAQLASVAETDGQQRLLDDHAGVQAMLLRDARLGDSPPAVGLGHQAAKAIIGLQRVPAGRDKIQNLLERLLL